MGIFSTLLGGTLGFIMGGPLGLLLGATLGSSLKIDGGASRTRVGAHTQEELQAVFAVALTTLAAKVAKADGRVTQDEINAYDHFLETSMGMSPGERKDAARVFNAARDSLAPASEFAAQIGALMGSQADRKRDIITLLFMIAAADGHIHDAEIALIREITLHMGLSPADFDSCHATFMASGSMGQTSPYEVLGVTPEVTDAELRTAHRRLVREYHPDVLQSKGLPAEFLEFAEEKMAAVNNAWSQVKKSRGM